MFDHFRMELTGIFSSAQRSKANEGVRIAHLNPNTRMNSKEEFRQGTNIMMQPVRALENRAMSKVDVHQDQGGQHEDGQGQVR